MEQVRVCTGVAAVYESRKPGALLADELLCGMAAEVLERYSDGFCYVKSFYGYGGYVKAHCLTPAEGVEGERQLLVTGSYVNLQQEPRVKSVALASLPRGSRVWGQGPAMGGWQPVMLAGGAMGFLPVVHLAAYPLGQGLERVEWCSSLCRHGATYLGSCYRWGGKTPLGLDCSGLCSQIYLNYGVSLYRDAALREGYGAQELPGWREHLPDCLEPGDLLYFPRHMALYLGEGRYLHSAASAGGVTVNSLLPGTVDYREDLAKGLLQVGRVQY